MVSSSAPHAGHLALSALLNRFRYSFSGTCVILSCAIALAALREMSGALIACRNFLEGEVLSIRSILRPLVDCFQLFVHLFLSMSLWALLTAEGFISRGFL